MGACTSSVAQSLRKAPPPTLAEQAARLVVVEHYGVLGKRREGSGEVFPQGVAAPDGDTVFAAPRADDESFIIAKTVIVWSKFRQNGRPLTAHRPTTPLAGILTNRDRTGGPLQQSLRERPELFSPNGGRRCKSHLRLFRRDGSVPARRNEEPRLECRVGAAASRLGAAAFLGGMRSSAGLCWEPRRSRDFRPRRSSAGKRNEPSARTQVVAMINKEGDVAYHRYGYPTSKHVIHAVGFDFRTYAQRELGDLALTAEVARDLLAGLYGKILELAAKHGRKKLRLVPISSGIFAGRVSRPASGGPNG